MSTDRLRSIDIDKIYLRDDVVKREVDFDFIAELAGSINLSGMQTPIRVRPISKYLSGVRFDAWELIAGRHRFEAAKMLGWAEIDANVQDIDDTLAEIAMIDENLRRHDVTASYFCYSTFRLKELYELQFPSVAKPGPKPNCRNNCDNSGEPDRYTLAASRSSGKSERSHQLGFTIARRFKDKFGSASDVLMVAGTSLDSITELDALSRLTVGDITTAVTKAVGGETVTAKPSPVAKLKSVPAVTTEDAPFHQEAVADGKLPKDSPVESVVQQPSSPIADDADDQVAKVQEIVECKRDKPVSALEAMATIAPPEQDRKAMQRQKFWEMWASLDDDVRQDLHRQLSTMSIS